MAFNGSGVFVRVYNWVTDRANNIVVSADRMDTEDDGFAAGLSNCITKDGQQTITNDIPWSNHKITGLGTATVRTDATNLGQVQDSTAQWSSTTGGTANAITVSTSPAITAYVAGQTVRFVATNNNSAATTISWSGLTAKNAYWNGAAMVGGEIISGSLYEATYDGTQFQVIGVTSKTPSFGDTITQTSTDAGAGAAPTLEQYRNSASPAAADLLGVTKYTGQNSTPAKVTYATFGAKIDDPTAASEDASLVATLKSAGSDISVLLNAFGLSINGITAARTAEGRLTLTSGTAITTSDVTAATTVYWTPFRGNQIAVYNGSRWEIRTFSEMSVSVPATTTTPFDVFYDYNSGSPQLVATSWTNDTTRATALATQDGVLVKSGTTTQRYLGTGRTTGVSGQTEDSIANRFLWNYYNRSPRIMRAVDTADNWTYSTASFRQANANTANQLNYIQGISEDPVTAVAKGGATNSTSAGVNVQIGIGLDSTTVNSATMRSVASATNAQLAIIEARYEGFPGIGKHSLMWLEQGVGGTVQTWYGDSAGVGQNGITGIIIG